MLYKNLILTASAFAISSIFAVESQAVPTLNDGHYDGDKLANDLGLVTPDLITEVTDRSNLSEPNDRVNASSGDAQYFLTTATKHPMNVEDYYNAISVQTRQKAFNNQGLMESVHPIVTAQIITSRSLTDDEVNSLKSTAQDIVKNGTSLTIIHGTRNSIKRLMNLDPTAKVQSSRTGCVPTPKSK